MQGTYQNQVPPQGQPVQNQYSSQPTAQSQQPVQNRQQATAPNQRASAGQAAQGQTSGMQANASVPAGTSPMDGQFGMQETASMAYGMPPAFGGGMPAQAPPAANQNTAAMQNQAAGQPAQNVPVFKPDMPIEQIYAQMTYPVAAAVVIPIGYNHGKTLGQVAVEKPKDLQWYVNEYKGPDNILRAAARYLIDKATNQAA